MPRLIFECSAFNVDIDTETAEKMVSADYADWCSGDYVARFEARDLDEVIETIGG